MASLFSRLGLAGLSAALLLAGAAVPPAQAEEFTKEQVARGEYLARAGDCISCHTAASAAYTGTGPGRQGPPYAGGLAISTPYGTLISPNITPDNETGIGTWNSDDFWRTARGDFDHVAALCSLDEAQARTARGLAERCRHAGFRPWAIASAPEQASDWSLLGVIPVKATRAGRVSDRSSFTFVKIWSFLLRFLHWTWALLILILIATGLEIQTMYLTAGTTRTDTGFYFGYVRLIHLTSGWLLAAVVLARLADAFLTRNRFEDWRSLIPFRSLNDMKGFIGELMNYVLLRNDEGKKYLGHDPLAQLSFTFIYAVMIAIIVSGFAIYGMYDPRNWFFALFQWPIRMFGGNEVRLFHVTMMWLIILFVPLHIYLVVRADGYAREGSLSAMLSGGRWVRRGASFEDAPDPEALDLRLKG